MDDLGARVSHLTVEKGIRVLSSDGREVGEVELVLSDGDTGIFDGIVVDTSLAPGGWRFADAAQVADLRERGVVLTLDAKACERLPEPSDNPAVMEAEPGDEPDSPLVQKLRRAWNLLSGRG